ncbi:hypothetical protein WOA01_11860 [Methylocystis sp. IM2]|uniref:hypothetical protein n=2 Tax=Methylocystis TaxID=133 RepID=UPI000FC1A72D|nr:MAG: hypothetical protein EKK29_08840 [Hyphomicrobiales bacterium]
MTMFAPFEDHQQEASSKTLTEYRTIKMFVSLLRDLSDTFDDDLHDTLIIAVIHQRQKREELVARQTGGCLDFTAKGVRLMDLVRKLNIPRETARRKLMALEKKGLVEKDNEGGWQLKTVDGRPAVDLPIEPFIARRLKDLMSLSTALDMNQ